MQQRLPSLGSKCRLTCHTQPKGMHLALQVASCGFLFINYCNSLTVSGPDVVTYLPAQYPITQGTIIAYQQLPNGTYQSTVQASVYSMPIARSCLPPLCYV